MKYHQGLSQIRASRRYLLKVDQRIPSYHNPTSQPTLLHKYHPPMCPPLLCLQYPMTCAECKAASIRHSLMLVTVTATLVWGTGKIVIHMPGAITRHLLAMGISIALVYSRRTLSHRNIRNGIGTILPPVTTATLPLPLPLQSTMGHFLGTTAGYLP